MNNKGPTRAQLQKKIAKLELEVATLKDKLVYFEAGDTVRQEGEHWYELVEHFDAKMIQRLPVKDGRAYIMGRLAGLNVVEVSKSLSEDQDKLVKLGQWLEANGVEALIVTEGVRFLKIRTVDPAIEARLDAHEEAKDAQEENATASA